MVSTPAKSHLQDNNEDRRMGMLVVWIDEAQIKNDDPLLAIAINLSGTLKLTGGETGSVDLAHVGFTVMYTLESEYGKIILWCSTFRRPLGRHGKSMTYSVGIFASDLSAMLKDQSGLRQVVYLNNYGCLLSATCAFD